MRKRIASIVLSVCLCLSLLPTAAFAEGGTPETTGVSYLYYNESTGEMKNGTKADGYTTVTSSTGDTSWSGWYVVKDEGVKIDGTVTLTGETHLILCDGADLTVTGGITDSYGSKNLTIYGQSIGDNVGKLTANNPSSDGDGISAWGIITIDGGVVEANGINVAGLVVHGGSITCNGEFLVSGLTATGGEFNSDVNIFMLASKNAVTGGTFNNKITIDSDYNITDLLADGYIFQSTADIADKQKDEYYKLSELAGEKTLSNVRVVKCSHSTFDTEGKCFYCTKPLVASLISGTNTSYYMDLSEAIGDAKAGDTIVLLTNVMMDSKIESKSEGFILDLNGKTLSSLYVYNAIVIKDTVGGGKINLLWVMKNNLKVIDLLETGYAFKGENSTWYDNTHNAGKRTVHGAEVKLIPIDSVSITAEKSYPYGEIKLTANVVQQEGVTGEKTYKWTPVGTTGNDKTATKADGSDLMVDAGSSYTYQLTVTVDGYSVDSGNTVTFSVVKATPKVSTPLTATVTYGDEVQDTDIRGEMKAGGRSVPGTFTWKDVTSYGNATNGTARTLKATFTPDDDKNYNSVDDLDVSVTVDKAASAYTAPTANTLTYTGEPQELITAGSSNDGTMQYKLDNGTWGTAIPKAANAGNYTVSYKVVGDANHADSTEGSLTVTIARKSVTPTVTVTQSSMVYDGTAKTPAVTVKDGETTIPTGEYEVAYSNNINAGTATVTVTDKENGNYAIGTAGTTFDIGKAKLPAPTFGTISESGKKLSDVTVNKDGKADTFSWDKGDDTEVKRGESYAWTLTPTDTDNYDTLTGSYTPWPAPSSGGGSSSSTTVTVPVSSDHATIEVKVEVSKGNATVEVSDKQLEKVIADHAGEVTIDVSDLKNVESATVPSHVVEKTNEAENTGLTVSLPAGSVTLDETALGSVTENADGRDVTVSVVAVPTEKLPTAVKEVIGMEPMVLAVVDVNVTISGKKQSSFDGGKVTISVPYTPKAGEDTGKLTVWFIKDDGTIENKGGYYDAKNKCFVFETDHLSQYLLVNTNELVSFTDVPADAYYAAAVNWAVKQNITGGIGDSKFGPDLSCTRAQLVTFLWRAAGSPEPKAASSFTDVPADAYYAQAVAWAVENSITGGIGNNRFAPDLTCTRAQAAAFLFRYAAANGMEAVTLQELVGGYGDAAQVPGYALPAFNWALAQGIVNGNNGNLMPNNDCTRAQIVTMLYRLLGTN